MENVGRQRLIAGAATAVSQAIALTGVAIFGILIAAHFGSNARTDGFFLANSIYAVALFIGQSFRSTTVSEMIHDRETGFGNVLKAVSAVAIGTALAFVLVAFAAVPVLTERLPESGSDSARDAMLWLAPAAALQLLCGTLAAQLAARDRVASAAWGYTAGTLAGLAAFPLLVDPLGINAIAISLLTGTVVGVVVLALTIDRGGRPSLANDIDAVTAVRRGSGLLLGASGLIGAQLVVASSTAFAARLGEQQSTTYAYAVMALSLIIAATVTPANVVFAPVLAREWKGDVDDLIARAVRTFRFGSLVVVPAVVLLAIVGPELAAAVLSKFSRSQVDEVITIAVILSPSALATLAAVIPELSLLTTGRFKAVAAIAAGVLVLHLAITSVAVLLGGGLQTVAGCAAITACLLAVAMAWRAVGTGYLGGMLTGYVRAILELVLVPVIAYMLAWQLLATGDSFAPDVAAFVLGSLLSATWLMATQRDELRGWVRLIRPERA